MPRARCAMLWVMNVDDLQRALGRIVIEAAYLEQLAAAVTSALGVDCLRIGDQLRLELGHPVNAEIS